ncbi:hypothetical protein RirG_240220 [Rhizophagus irregularis DAOM 197198w]|uniref:Serine-enriched protein n=2 Tax=Rhizophagus irregularis TaxID=588596 RepID=A0A015IID4_RHIIW|nr:hypothetical protein RirG_240220 [Rhizophagus irregularis DAOM 197198w]
MSNQFFSKLSQDYIEGLKDDEYYDITIEVGEDPNVKIFRAHMIILYYRSPFLRRTLAAIKKNNDGTLVHIKFPNIPPEIFHIILNGTILLNEEEPSEILRVLAVADQLDLQEIIIYLQEYLINNKFEWMEQHFGFVYQTSFQSNTLLELQNFCTNLMTKFPQKIFNSFDFTLISEKSLISLIKKDDLLMKEVEIWEHVLKWGLEKNYTLLSDPATWSDDHFEAMRNTLQHCLPLVRFFWFSSKDFYRKVHPYEKLLGYQLYEDLLESYLDPDSVPNDNIILPRYKNSDGIIDSTIINPNIVSLVSRWIDNINYDIKSNFASIRELYLVPYEFKLLLRGSRDGFTPKKFHELCDNIPNTMTFIKIKGTEEIIGGYNPLKWQISHDDDDDGEWGETKDSFIFSFKNKDNFKESILSRVNDASNAIYYHNRFGPTFGEDDINVFVYNDDSREYSCWCEQRSYEKEIIDTEDVFSMEDYEVFQIIKKCD